MEPVNVLLVLLYVRLRLRRLKRLKLLWCTTSGAYAITVTLDDQFVEAKAH